MSSTEDHIREAIDFLDPEKGLVDIGRARSEMRNALSHYYIEKECSHENNRNKS